MKDRWTLTLTIRDNFGGGAYSMAVDGKGIMAFDDRLVENIRKPAPVPGMLFDDLVNVMKARELRRDIIILEAKRLGQRLADHIEDKEGWHGDDRRDAARGERA